jgi:hypothetical protein
MVHGSTSAHQAMPAPAPPSQTPTPTCGVRTVCTYSTSDENRHKYALSLVCCGRSLLVGMDSVIVADTSTPAPPMSSCARLYCPVQDAVVIGARLDVESSGDSCRLAFYGRLLAQMGQGGPQELQRLKVFKVVLLVVATSAWCRGHA